MKKFEGILTVFGVMVIIGLPLFLMFADIHQAPDASLSDTYISVQSYAEEIGDKVDNIEYEEAYPVLDGYEARLDINDVIEIVNDDVIPLGLTPLIIESDVPNVPETPKVDTVPIVSEVIESTEILESDSIAIISEDGIIIFDNTIPEGIIEIPTEETIFDTNTFEEFGDDEEELFEDEVLPEAIEALPEDLGDEGNNEDAEIALGSIEEEQETLDEIIITDESIPEALTGTGADNIEVTTEYGDNYETHSVRMDYITYDELGNEIVKTVAFSY